MADSGSSISSVSRSFGTGRQSQQDEKHQKQDNRQNQDKMTTPTPSVTLSPTLLGLKVGDFIAMTVTGHDAYGRTACVNSHGLYIVVGVSASKDDILKLEITSTNPLKALVKGENQHVLMFITAIKGPVDTSENHRGEFLPPKLQSAPQLWQAADTLHISSQGGLPIDDEHIYDGLLSFWRALKSGSAEAWTGPELRQAVHQEYVSDLWTSLQRDMALLSEALFEAQDWQPWTFPILTHEKVMLLTLFCNQEGGFSLELQSPDHGRLIISGYEIDGVIDVKIQSEKELNRDIKTQLYQNVKTLDQASKIDFKTGPVHDPRRTVS